ncbi:MAG TPA: S1/P1 nuclease, partial [Pyrinomonadaceae bacterium]
IIDKTMNLSEDDKKDPAKVDDKETAYITSLPLPKSGSKELALMQAGDIFKWTNDSYTLAVNQAYGTLPPIDTTYKYTTKDSKTGKNVTKAGGYRLDAPYYEANKETVNKQLMLGGVRLARFLNEDLGGQAKK